MRPTKISTTGSTFLKWKCYGGWWIHHQKFQVLFKWRYSRLFWGWGNSRIHKPYPYSEHHIGVSDLHFRYLKCLVDTYGSIFHEYGGYVESSFMGIWLYPPMSPCPRNKALIRDYQRFMIVKNPLTWQPLGPLLKVKLFVGYMRVSMYRVGTANLQPHNVQSVP